MEENFGYIVLLPMLIGSYLCIYLSILAQIISFKTLNKKDLAIKNDFYTGSILKLAIQTIPLFIFYLIVYPLAKLTLFSCGSDYVKKLNEFKPFISIYNKLNILFFMLGLIFIAILTIIKITILKKLKIQKNN